MLYIWLLSFIGSIAAASAYYATEPLDFAVGAGVLAFVFAIWGVSAKDGGLRQLLEWLYRFSFALPPFGIAALVWQRGTFPAWVGDAIIVGGLGLQLLMVTFMFLRRNHPWSFSVLAGIMSLPVIGPLVGPLAWAFWRIAIAPKPAP